MTELEDPNDPFNEVNSWKITLIMLTRMYDLLAAIALKLPPEQVEQILNEHEQGYTRSPAPAYRMRDEDDVP